MQVLGKAMNAQKANRHIKREVSKALRELMQPMLTKRRAAVLRLPSKGHAGPGMRAAVARQTRAATRWSGEQGGVSVIQRARGMPRGFNMAGRVFNRAEGWNPTTLAGEKVHQQMRPVEWFDSQASHGDAAAARQKIVHALAQTADKLASEIHR
jgi:hypothetical protein